METSLPGFHETETSSLFAPQENPALYSGDELRQECHPLKGI